MRPSPPPSTHIHTLLIQLNLPDVELQGVVNKGVVLSLKPILKNWQLCLLFKFDVVTT